MPDHHNDFFNLLQNGSPFWIPIGVLIASLIGSIHCVGMCGAIVANASHTGKRGVILYHFGRLVGYLLLGTVAGVVGDQLLSKNMALANLIAGILMGGMFLLMGIKLLKAPSLHFKLPSWMNDFYGKTLGRAMRSKTTWRGFLIGLLTPLLPCGWLYSFILASVATQNPAYSAILMFFFWIGTLPALTVLGFFAKRPFDFFGIRTQKIAALILITVGLVTIYLRIAPTLFNHSGSQPLICF